MSATTTKRRPRRDSYLDMIKAHPLRAIRSNAEALAASRSLNRFILSKPRDEWDAGERQYVAAAMELIRSYENDAKFPSLPKTGPLDVLRFLMTETGMTVGDLGRVIGSQPNASLILSGKRALSKANILSLGKFFHLNPGIFLDG